MVLPMSDLWNGRRSGRKGYLYFPRKEHLTSDAAPIRDVGLVANQFPVLLKHGEGKRGRGVGKGGTGGRGEGTTLPLELH